MRKPFAYRPQRGQAHHHVPELTKIDDEYVPRIECHFKEAADFRGLTLI